MLAARAATAVILAFVAATMVWLQLDTVPPLWDEAHYLRASHELYRVLLNQGPVAFLAAFSQALGTKAPLIAVLPFPFYALFGESYASACYGNVALLALASWLLFGLGRRVAGPGVALAAVVVLDTFPLVAGMSRSYLVELMLTTLVIAWMLLLVRWRDGEIERPWWGLGLLLGLGLLAKVTFPLYVAAPTLLAIAPALRRERRQRRVLAAGLARVGALGGAVAALWYLPNGRQVFGYVVEGGFGGIARGYSLGDVFSLATVAAYWLELASFGVSAFYALALALAGGAAALSWWRHRRAVAGPPRHLDLLVAWWLAPFLALTFTVVKEIRYATPYLPALALLLAAAIARLVPGRGGRLTLALVAGLGLLQYGFYSFAAPRPPRAVAGDRLVLLGTQLRWARPPITERWPDEAVVRLLARHAKARGEERPRATLLFSHPRLTVHHLNYLAVLSAAPVRFDTCAFQSPTTPRELADGVRQSAAYVLTKSGDLGGAKLNAKNVEVLAILGRDGMPFAEIASFDLPDGSALQVLARSEL